MRRGMKSKFKHIVRAAESLDKNQTKYIAEAAKSLNVLI